MYVYILYIYISHRWRHHQRSFSDFGMKCECWALDVPIDPPCQLQSSDVLGPGLKECVAFLVIISCWVTCNHQLGCCDYRICHLLVLNVGNGWVAGGCWDLFHSYCGSFPKIPYVKRTRVQCQNTSDFSDLEGWSARWDSFLVGEEGNQELESRWQEWLKQVGMVAEAQKWWFFPILSDSFLRILLPNWWVLTTTSQVIWLSFCNISRFNFREVEVDIIDFQEWSVKPQVTHLFIDLIFNWIDCCILVDVEMMWILFRRAIFYLGGRFHVRWYWYCGWLRNPAPPEGWLKDVESQWNNGGWYYHLSTGSTGVGFLIQLVRDFATIHSRFLEGEGTMNPVQNLSTAWPQAGPEEEVFVELPMGALIATDGEDGHFQPRGRGFRNNYTDVYQSWFIHSQKTLKPLEYLEFQVFTD